MRKIKLKNPTKQVENSLVSVIVPTYNSAKFLEACLKSIKNQTYKNIELIVVDNNSTDDTKAIAKKYTDKIFNKCPERSAQRNYGAKKAAGEYFLFIDSDMELSKQVVSACIDLVMTTDVKAIVIPEESFGQGFWAQCKKLERSFYLGVDWMEAARFFTKKIFNEFKGYDEENSGTEDYDLPQRIESKFGQSSVSRIEKLIYHNERNIRIFKLWKKKYYYAKKLDAYKSAPENYANYKKQSSIMLRYKLFFSQPRKLISRPLLGIGLLVMKTGEFVAGGLGYFNSIFNRKLYK